MESGSESNDDVNNLPLALYFIDTTDRYNMFRNSIAIHYYQCLHN